MSSSAGCSSLALLIDGKGHRTIDPQALKIPARRAEYSLTENAASPFHAEPRHIALLPFCGIVYIYQGMAERFNYLASGGLCFSIVPYCQSFEHGEHSPFAR